MPKIRASQINLDTFDHDFLSKSGYYNDLMDVVQYPRHVMAAQRGAVEIDNGRWRDNGKGVLCADPLDLEVGHMYSILYPVQKFSLANWILPTVSAIASVAELGIEFELGVGEYSIELPMPGDGGETLILLTPDFGAGNQLQGTADNTKGVLFFRARCGNWYAELYQKTSGLV